MTPGATREGCRDFHHRYEVDWGTRTGYLKMALKYGLRIVPVAGTGVDDCYIGLNDGYALSKKVNMPKGIPLWAGLGPLGLWPFSPPFPVRVTQWVGAPIDPAEVLAAHSALEEPMQRQILHTKVRASVQALLDEGRARP